MRNRIVVALKMMLPLATATLAACCDKGPDYNTDHPEQGKIVLATDWSQSGEGVGIPGKYCVRFDGDEAGRQVFVTAVDPSPGLFEPGTHHMDIWTESAGITVSGETASVRVMTVEREDDSPLGRSDFAYGGIDWFFSTAQEVEVEADKVYNVTAVMQPRVRELTLMIEPTGGTVDGIESITAMLSGAAGTLDLGNGTHGTPSFVLLPFTKISSGVDAGKWSATVRLLGIADGAEPRLTGVISFAGGSPADILLDSDLSGVLAGFNYDMKTPVVVGGTVVVTPSEAGFEASISSWVTVDRPGVVAD